MTERTERTPQPLARQDIAVGALVRGGDGFAGTVERVETDAATGEATNLIVRDEAGERYEIPVAVVVVDTAAGGLRLMTEREAAESGITALQDVGDRILVPVREEVLVPTTHPIEIGRVRIRKRIEEVPAEGTTELYHDEIDVVRVPINRAIDAVPGPRNEGDTLIVPVIEEVVVTEKRLMLREEIRVTRRRVSERVPYQGTVRREVVEIEESTITDAAPAQPVARAAAPAQPVARTAAPADQVSRTPAPDAQTSRTFEPDR